MSLWPIGGATNSFGSPRTHPVGEAAPEVIRAHGLEDGRLGALLSPSGGDSVGRLAQIAPNVRPGREEQRIVVRGSVRSMVIGMVGLAKAEIVSVER